MKQSYIITLALNSPEFAPAPWWKFWQKSLSANSIQITRTLLLDEHEVAFIRDHSALIQQLICDEYPIKSASFHKLLNEGFNV